MPSFAPAVVMTQNERGHHGNRATIIFTDGKGTSVQPCICTGMGGPESVYAFLEELERRKQHCDQNYECARFIQLVGEFSDQGASAAHHSVSSMVPQRQHS